jgi:cell division protein FtsL
MQRIQSITHAYNQVPWRKQQGILVLFLLILVFIALVASLYLPVTARATTIGNEIQETLSEIAVLEREITSLEAYLADLQSVHKMEARARQLGFEPVQTDQTLYLLVPGYMPRAEVVIAPTGQAPVVSAEVKPAEFTEPLLPWLKRKLSKSIFPVWETQQ